MRLPTVRNWKSQSMSAALTEDATPPAAAALLLQAIAWAEDVALTPYVGCAHVFDGLTETAVETKHLAVVVAPGAVHMRAALGVSYAPFGVDPPSNPTDHAITSTASGAGADDVIKAAMAIVFDFESRQFWSLSQVVLSSDTVDDQPAATKRRQIEVQTLAAPYVEPMSVTQATSFAVAVSQQLADLEGL